MSMIQAQATREYPVPGEKVYALLADYNEGHPSILPKSSFTQFNVEEGGQGAGTIVHFRMKVMGTEREFRQIVSEPEPGRVLVETDLDSNTATTFTVEPLADNTRSRLTISTTIQASPGVTGWIERLITPTVLRRIYEQELALIAEALSQ